MLVVITYDVNTETAAGRKRCGRLPGSASIMDSVCRIPCLNA